MMAEGSIKKRAQAALAFLLAMRDAGATCIQAQNAMHNQGTGKIAELFPTDEDRKAWKKTAEHAEFWKVLEEMPMPTSKAPGKEFSGKLVLRLPKSLHAALSAEADEEGVSLNQLLLAKVSMRLGR